MAAEGLRPLLALALALAQALTLALALPPTLTLALALALALALPLPLASPREGSPPNRRTPGRSFASCRRGGRGQGQAQSQGEGQDQGERGAQGSVWVGARDMERVRFGFWIGRNLSGSRPEQSGRVDSVGGEQVAHVAGGDARCTRVATRPDQALRHLSAVGHAVQNDEALRGRERARAVVRRLRLDVGRLHRTRWSWPLMPWTAGNRSNHQR